MSKKGKKIYVEMLYNQLKVAIVFLVVIIAIFLVYKTINKKETNIKEKGVKVEATIIDIHERNNPLHDRYKANRNIEEITVQYTYKNKKYTSKTSTIPNRYIDVNDTVENAYILEDNPDEVIICTSTKDTISLLIVPFLGLLFLVGIICIISLIKQIKLYKNAFENFSTIKAEYIRVENKVYNNLICYILYF